MMKQVIIVLFPQMWHIHIHNLVNSSALGLKYTKQFTCIFEAAFHVFQQYLGRHRGFIDPCNKNNCKRHSKQQTH